MPQVTAEGARRAAGRCLPLLEIASGIERQHELLPALVPDKRIVRHQELLNSLCRSRAMGGFDGMPIQIRVFDDNVAARRNERRVGVQLCQDMLLGVARVEDDQDAGRAFGSPAHLAQDPI